MGEIWPFEPAVREVIALLARRNYAALEQLSGGIRLTASEMAAAVSEYGRKIVLPPDGEAPLEVIPHLDGNGWSVDVPLWTVEEGESDLTLQLTVREGPGRAHEIEIDDIHVL